MRCCAYFQHLWRSSHCLRYMRITRHKLTRTWTLCGAKLQISHPSKYTITLFVQKVCNENSIYWDHITTCYTYKPGNLMCTAMIQFVQKITTEFSKYYFQEVHSSFIIIWCIWKLDLYTYIYVFGSCGSLNPLPHTLILMQQHLSLVKCLCITAYCEVQPLLKNNLHYQWHSSLLWKLVLVCHSFKLHINVTGLSCRWKFWFQVWFWH
jgi:hypothetical protein